MFASFRRINVPLAGGRRSSSSSNRGGRESTVESVDKCPPAVDLTSHHQTDALFSAWSDVRRSSPCERAIDSNSTSRAPCVATADLWLGIVASTFPSEVYAAGAHTLKAKTRSDLLLDASTSSLMVLGGRASPAQSSLAAFHQRGRRE